jgi:hypothetical protein
MFQLRPQTPALPPKKQAVPTTIVLAAMTPAMESLALAVAKEHPHVVVATADKHYTYTPIGKDGVALETQQLDHSAELAAIDEVKETLDKYDEEHPHTGPLHVYLLDGQGKAVMDQEGEQTPLKALVNAALRDKRRVVAALMPQDVNYKEVGDIPPAMLLRQLADTVLAQESIPVLVGKAAFEAFVAAPESLSPVGEAQPAEPTHVE